MKQFDTNSLQIASPCPMSWDEMKGDDRTRHCDLCKLNVHNVADMTRDEVARLVGQNSARLCMRIVRRADGTVMTKDCPVGLRAYRRRVSGLATAAVASILGLFSISYSQDKDAKAANSSPSSISTQVTGKARIEGVVTDPNGAVVPDIKIHLFGKGQALKKGAKPFAQTVSAEDGSYKFDGIAPGVYEIKSLKGGGFGAHVNENVKVDEDRPTLANIMLNTDENVVMVGVVSGPEMIDMTSNERKTVFTREMLDRMPGGRPF